MSSSTRDQWEAFCESNPNRVTVSPAISKPHSCYESMVKKVATRLDSPCNIHLHSRRHRLLDVDNLYGKACIDGLRHSGFIKDDSPEYVQSVTYSQEKIPKTQDEETVITITAISSNKRPTTKKDDGLDDDTRETLTALKTQINASFKSRTANDANTPANRSRGRGD